MPELLDFSRLYPDIELDVDLSDRVVNLVEEGFDAAIRIGKPADSSLVTRRLCEMRIVLAASPSYIKANGMPTAVADLADHQCIIDTNFKDAEAWSFKESAVRPVTSVTVRGRFRLSNAEACLAAAREGLGIARLPSFVAGPCFQDGSLVPVLNDFEEPPGSLLALYPPARYLAPKVRALIDFLGARYRGVPNWDRAWIGGR
jgi:DNA-binding transcriptional LysR family regulator